MLNVFSIILGLIGLVLAIFALPPFMGWENWYALPFAIVGLALGVMSPKTAGRNLNLVVLAVAILRLFVGGGLI